MIRIYLCILSKSSDTAPIHASIFQTRCIHITPLPAQESYQRYDIRLYNHLFHFCLLHLTLVITFELPESRNCNWHTRTYFAVETISDDTTDNDDMLCILVASCNALRSFDFGLGWTFTELLSFIQNQLSLLPSAMRLDIRIKLFIWGRISRKDRTRTTFVHVDYLLAEYKLSFAQKLQLIFGCRF